MGAFDQQAPKPFDAFGNLAGLELVGRDVVPQADVHSGAKLFELPKCCFRSLHCSSLAAVSLMHGIILLCPCQFLFHGYHFIGELDSELRIKVEI
jgi:hypothetical protein